MKTVAYTTFQKQKLEGNSFQVVSITSDIHAKQPPMMTYITSNVSDIVTVTRYDKPSLILIPKKTDIERSLQPYFNELQQIINTNNSIIYVLLNNGQILTLTQN